MKKVAIDRHVLRAMRAQGGGLRFRYCEMSTRKSTPGSLARSRDFGASHGITGDIHSSR